MATTITKKEVLQMHMTLAKQLFALHNANVLDEHTIDLCITSYYKSMTVTFKDNATHMEHKFFFNHASTADEWMSTYIQAQNTLEQLAEVGINLNSQRVEELQKQEVDANANIVLIQTAFAKDIDFIEEEVDDVQNID